MTSLTSQPDSGRHGWVRAAFETGAMALSRLPWPGSRSARAKPETGRALVAVLVYLALMAVFVAAAGGMALAQGAKDAPAASAYAFNGSEKVERMRVAIDKSDTIRLEEPYAEALVGNSEIADVVPLTNRSLYVLGKKVGSTRLSILNQEKRLMGIVEVEVSYDVSGIRAHIRDALPHSGVEVKSLNGKIVLSGLVPDSPTMSKALSIAEQFAPESVINSMGVSSPQQVMLEVRFVEASRDATRNLGVQWDALSKGGGFDMVTNLGAQFAGSGAFPGVAQPFGSILTNVLNSGVSADVLVQALEERGLARRLAEPNLVALSGDTASFLAGGEFPFPVARDDDNITIEFKKFGVGLAFTPTVLNNGLINLKVQPEVSEIDPNNTLTVNDTTIPGLVTRRTKTTIELRDGQSFAIAGLLQSNHSKAQRQLPWIGQVPVLGTLFRSASYEKRETDLVIIVTPRLVRPAKPGEKLITPLDKSVASNDVDFFLKGKQEGWKTSVRQEKRRRRKKMNTGHMLELPQTPGRPAMTYKSSFKGGEF